MGTLIFAPGRLQFGSRTLLLRQEIYQELSKIQERVKYFSNCIVYITYVMYKHCYEENCKVIFLPGQYHRFADNKAKPSLPRTQKQHSWDVCRSQSLLCNLRLIVADCFGIPRSPGLSVRMAFTRIRIRPSRISDPDSPFEIIGSGSAFPENPNLTP